jgi:hypothetical protein
MPWPAVASTQAGHPYLSAAYGALTRDRARLAGLAALRSSLTLSAIAEAHSAYMASIGSWSDGDPAGSVLTRVRAAGIGATYAGQNVVTASGSTVEQAIESGEAFFAREATTGGPHWDNITNPSHHFVGIGVALLGSPGSYTLYLTQVFADMGGCSTSTADTLSQASAISGAPKIGSTIRLNVDGLNLRSEPGGLVIGSLKANDRLKVFAIQGNWAQIESLATQLFGWVYIPLLMA